MHICLFPVPCLIAWMMKRSACWSLPLHSPWQGFLIVKPCWNLVEPLRRSIDHGEWSLEALQDPVPVFLVVLLRLVELSLIYLYSPYMLWFLWIGWAVLVFEFVRGCLGLHLTWNYGVKTPLHVLGVQTHSPQKFCGPISWACCCQSLDIVLARL